MERANFVDAAVSVPVDDLFDQLSLNGSAEIVDAG
jgi:hypothetical protein